MSTQPLIKINPLHTIGEDDRGLTAEFCLPRKQDAFIFITRNAGSISGNTYHEGKTPSTNPKIFILLSGSILFSYRKIGTKKIHQEKITAPATIEVFPYVTHCVEAVSDFILLECNSIQDIQHDRFREEVGKNMINE